MGMALWDEQPSGVSGYGLGLTTAVGGIAAALWSPV